MDFDFLLLDEVLKRGDIHIEELSKDGSVPEIKVINTSAQMVLILDGEELVGAKQNRIVNTTILVGKASAIVIPVSCVEQGRWNYDSGPFSSRERVMAPSLRAMKSEQVQLSLKVAWQYRADQGAIWDEVAEKASRRGAESPSMAMSAIYDKEMPSIEEYVKNFSLVDFQIGAISAINGQVVGLDSLGKPASFAKVFKKLLQSYALDALDWYDPEEEKKALKSGASKFLKDCLAAETEAHAGVGLGIDHRIGSKNATGFALTRDDQLLHLCIFAKESRQKSEQSGARMRRFSARRNHRL
ncbi:ARPP-1 family domain-containing protein [Desulfoferrobacter suflitae]|uniref:ARPP-1 family domain-containing protein n=1 Tax=Desulfoferrobacter suflitae TaxID=2865782 RepID=UPI002164885E|nr:DUF6569 family protein [Desulfoferrobacter suflitae]MCK8600502.1 hypothetical protein [Desulfoferrobacter suflitae]